MKRLFWLLGLVWYLGCGGLPTATAQPGKRKAPPKASSDWDATPSGWDTPAPAKAAKKTVAKAAPAAKKAPAKKAVAKKPAAVAAAPKKATAKPAAKPVAAKPASARPAPKKATVAKAAPASRVVASRPAPAQPDTATYVELTPAKLNGLWKGPLQVLGGQLDMTVTIIPLAGGQYFAAFDVPTQKVKRMAVEVTVQGDSVLLNIPQADSRFAARYQNNRLVGTWTRSGIEAPVRLVHSALPAAATTGPSSRLTPPYREDEVVVPNPVSHLKLGGTLTIPAGPGPFPAVVLASDVGAQDRDGTTAGFAPLGLLADYLTRRGIAVLRLDDRGIGASGGNTDATTTAMRVTDVQAALNYLRTRLEIDINRIGVVGHGEGGNVGLLAAAQPLPPSFVVALAAYGMPGQQTLLQQQVDQLKGQNKPPNEVRRAYERQRTMYDIIRQTNVPQAQAIVANMLRQDTPELDAATAQLEAGKMLTPWKRYFLSFDPIYGLGEVRCPVLLLGGTADVESPADLHLTPLEQELKSVSRSITVKRLPGVNHLFQPPQTQWDMVSGQMRPVLSPLALETIRAWISR